MVLIFLIEGILFSYYFINRSNAALQYVSTMAKDKVKDNIMLTQAHEWEESYNFYKTI